MAGYYNYGYPYQQYQPMVQQATQQPQIQNSGFVSVRSKQEALMWPIAPGNSITFKDEGAPYIYTKTMGLSQLDRPIFETYRLIKEDAPESSQPTVQHSQTQQAGDTSNYALKSDLEVLAAAYQRLQRDLDTVKAEIGKAEQEVEENV